MLAHVDVGPVAASCFEPTWIAFAEARLGPAGERALGDDARHLAAALATHDALAAAHGVAFLFEGERQACAASSFDLADMPASLVVDPRALALARTAGAGAEILRAAAELELPHLASRCDEAGWAAPSRAALGAALAAITPAAPGLATMTIEIARPLVRRGRAFGGRIVVGAPGVASAEAEHLAWQAAHEATVSEIGASTAGFVETERRALALLRSRARRAGLSEGHARWLATLDLRGVPGERAQPRTLGPIPDEDDGAE